MHVTLFVVGRAIAEAEEDLPVWVISKSLYKGS